MLVDLDFYSAISYYSIKKSTYTPHVFVVDCELYVDILGFTVKFIDLFVDLIELCKRLADFYVYKN